jgi:hypothetical protein
MRVLDTKDQNWNLNMDQIMVKGKEESKELQKQIALALKKRR